MISPKVIAENIIGTQGLNPQELGFIIEKMQEMIAGTLDTPDIQRGIDVLDDFPQKDRIPSLLIVIKQTGATSEELREAISLIQ